MSDPIILTVPEEISARARQIADTTAQPVEQVLLDHLKTLSASRHMLPPEEQAELDALNYLSDDALWTIARDHMSDSDQARAHELMERSSRGTINDEEHVELQALVERADRLMVRKAEAATILRSRGHRFTQEDFKPGHE